VSRRARRAALLLALAGCTESGVRAPVHEAAPPPPVHATAPPPPAEGAPPAEASSPDSAARPWPAKPPPAVETDWCIELVSALDEETCYVLPDAPTRTLLIYLHGIVPPTKTSVQKTNFETVVANAARRAGVAALIPRGDQGLAPKQYDRWWGWPTATGASYQRLAPKLLDRIRDKRTKLQEIAGVEFERVYVAGSSSGAYFAAAIALRGGLADADGFGAMSGGAGARTPELAGLAPKPFYIGFGKHDSVAGSARALGTLLGGAGWPVRVAEHPVGHGAKEIYLDEAFAFWREHAR
jgi:predicted esterase